MKLNDKLNESVFIDDELTCYGFISHMKSYIKSLLDTPVLAKPDNYLQYFGIDGPKALEMLMDKNKPYGPIIQRVEKIKTGEDNKDRFYVKYTLLNNDNNLYEKMKKIYNKYINNGKLIKEEGEGGMLGGATSCGDSSGAYETPINKPIKRKTIYITNEQLDYIKEAVEMDTMHGDFGYDAPGLKIDKNDPSMNHENMIKKSFNEEQIKKYIRNTILEALAKRETQDVFVDWTLYNENTPLNIKMVHKLIDDGIIPEELIGDFKIGVRIIYDNYDYGYDNEPESKEISRSFFGEYEEAMKYIQMIKDEKIKKYAIKSLNDSLYSDNYRLA